MLEAVGLRNELQDADIVVTGEGCLDFQTDIGKVPVGVAQTEAMDTETEQKNVTKNVTK